MDPVYINYQRAFLRVIVIKLNTNFGSHKVITLVHQHVFVNLGNNLTIISQLECFVQ